jgi:hypothetical protein
VTVRNDHLSDERKRQEREEGGSRGGQHGACVQRKFRRAIDYSSITKFDMNTHHDGDAL